MHKNERQKQDEFYLCAKDLLETGTRIHPGLSEHGQSFDLSKSVFRVRLGPILLVASQIRTIHIMRYMVIS